MITFKSLSKKLLKLEASMQKDAKKLSKIIRKIEKAGSTEAKPDRARPAPRAPSRPAKAKRKLTPEGRAKLRAIMNARWSAKRAAAAASDMTPVASGGEQPRQEDAGWTG